ncbi:hypothetical protein CHS0354_040572 [Potamilus streckersoni]|uniref:Uncharacterized protein n=1 Tax=Potamilus streckersoni TaxID=2493646 RepID=A0AAE0VWE3_9BIVA|nr:hypothetical protein CHS0354_040572 [Potamilus streckersoni]
MMRQSTSDFDPSKHLPPTPSMGPPMFPNINMPPPWAMHAQAFLGSPPADHMFSCLHPQDPYQPSPQWKGRKKKNKFQSRTPLRQSDTSRRSHSRTRTSRRQLSRSPLSRSPHQRRVSRSRARSKSCSPRRSCLNFHSITTTARSSPPSTTDDKIESKLEPLPVPEMDQLELDPDEISRWEKEEERFTDSSPDFKSKVALEKKALPRSVMESAGKVLSQKPMQPTLASAMSSPSIKPQPAKTRHHVFLDIEGTPEER